MSCNDSFPFNEGEVCFDTGLDEQIIDFVTDLDNTGLPIDQYTGCKFEFREDNSLNSPAIGAPLIGTVEDQVDPDDGVTKKAAVLTMTDAKKKEILGDLKTRIVFGAFLLTRPGDEFPLWHANIKIIGVS